MVTSRLRTECHFEVVDVRESSRTLAIAMTNHGRWCGQDVGRVAKNRGGPGRSTQCGTGLHFSNRDRFAGKTRKTYERSALACTLELVLSYRAPRAIPPKRFALMSNAAPRLSVPPRTSASYWTTGGALDRLARSFEPSRVGEPRLRPVGSLLGAESCSSGHGSNSYNGSGQCEVKSSTRSTRTRWSSDQPRLSPLDYRTSRTMLFGSPRVAQLIREGRAAASNHLVEAEVCLRDSSNAAAIP